MKRATFGRAGFGLAGLIDRPTSEYPPATADRKTVSSWCDFGVAWKTNAAGFDLMAGAEARQ